jgi:hypothetical protein
MTRGSFFVTLGGSTSAIDSDDGNASTPVERLLSTFFRSGDMVGLVEAPWLFDLRVLNVMELGGTNALRLDEDSAVRGSRRASRFEVRSNHGGSISSLVPRADIGPRRFLASFSSCTYRASVLGSVHTSRGSHHLNIFRGPPGLPRVIFPRSALSIHKTGEVSHSSAEQRLVTVSTLENAHDSTLGPLIGKRANIPRKAIEKRGWDLPIVP